MHSRIKGLLATLLLGTGSVMAQVPSAVVNSTPPAAVAPVGDPMMIGQPIGTGQPILPPEAVIGSGEPIFYGSADYLLWKIRRGNLPQTVTTTPVGVIAVNTTDLLSRDPSGTPNFPGNPTRGYLPVSIVNEATFGAGPYTDLDSQNGGRFTLGFWTDTDLTFGVEASFLFIERGSDRFAAVSGQRGNQFLLDTGFTRNLYFINGADRELLSSFDVFVVREATTSVTGAAASSLYGAEINARSMFARVGGIDVGFLSGFRFLNFNDELQIFSNSRLFSPPGIPPTDADATASLSRDLNIRTFDRTRIYNYFYGAQVGLDLESNFGPVFINTRVKAAVGTMYQHARVEGRTEVVNNDPRVSSPPSYTSGGGFLSGAGDQGSHSRYRFAFIPEVNVKVGYQFTSWLKGYVGYDGLLLGHIARAGSSTVTNTLNTTVSVAQQPDIRINLNQPSFRFKDQDVWVQGINFGFEANY